MNKVQNQVDEISSIASHNKVVGKTKRPNSKESTSVKAYIGHEYECPRGHRYWKLKTFLFPFFFTLSHLRRDVFLS